MTRDQTRELNDRCLEFDRQMMAEWSDAELLEASKALREASGALRAEYRDGMLLCVLSKPLPVTVEALREELRRRIGRSA